MTTAATARLRFVGAVQTAGGAALLAFPDVVGHAAAGGRYGSPPPWIVRVLGLRVAGQGALTAIRPDKTVARLGAASDALHATSMVALAVLSRRYRRVALVSAAVASASAATTVAADASTREASRQ